MITCGYCGCRGCLTEFAYVAQAGGTGPAVLRRCPSCGELVIVDGVEARDPHLALSRLRGMGTRARPEHTEDDKEV